MLALLARRFFHLAFLIDFQVKGVTFSFFSAITVRESALCLLTPEKLSPLGRIGRVSTLMPAFGDALLRRLAASGRFEIESEVLLEA